MPSPSPATEAPAALLSGPNPALPICCACGGRSWRGPAVGSLHRCAGCRAVFNARSTGIGEEEARYRDYSAGPPPGAERIAHAQWAWVRGTGVPCRSVLDLGCGYGHFLQVAREDGARAAGIELDPSAVRACAAAGLEVAPGSLLSADVPEGPWDAITFWDVLEHLEDPFAGLRIALDRMSPDGLLVIRGRNAGLHVPMRGLFRRLHPLFRALRVPDLSCVHRWGFDPTAYRRLLLRAGFDRVQVFPGLPTAGDRFATFGGAGAAATVKAAIRGASGALHALSLGRLFLFPSVLITARKPPA